MASNTLPPPPAPNGATPAVLPLDVLPPPPPRLELTRVNLLWTTEKIGPGVNVSGDGTTASRSASGGGVQLTNEWMTGGRDPHVYTIAVVLEDVLPETTIGIVGRNFWPSEWAEPLTKSNHAVVLECGTGRFSVKGKSTSFLLKPLTRGAKLNLTLDMQVQELTVDLLGTSPGQIVSSVTVENIPAEVTLAVGFGAGGPQCIRVVGCTMEKPEMKLLGKLKKDLWDEDNKVEPLPLNMKKERGMLQQQQNIANMALSLEM